MGKILQRKNLCWYLIEVEGFIEKKRGGGVMHHGRGEPEEDKQQRGGMRVLWCKDEIMREMRMRVSRITTSFCIYIFCKYFNI